MSKVTILTKPNRIVIASKGVQGPPGKDGVITPELEGLRDEAQQAAQEAASSESAAQGYASSASDAADAASQSADAAAASADLAEQARLLGATIGFATKADMDASLAHPDGTLALVTNDATASNNGTYRKTGASGSGAWVQSADRVSGLEGRVYGIERDALFGLVGVNKFDKSSVTPGFSLTASGIPFPSSGRNLSRIFQVTPNTEYYASYVQRIAWHSAPGVVISATGVTPSAVTSPAGANYAQIEVADINLHRAQFEEGSIATPFQPYKLTLKPDAVTNEALSDSSVSTSKVRPFAILPAHLEAVEFLNMHDGSYRAGLELSLTDGQTETVAPTRAIVDWIPCRPNTEYTASEMSRVFFYDVDRTFLSLSASKTFTTPAGCYWLRFNVAENLMFRFQLNEGDVATAPWPQPHKFRLKGMVAAAQSRQEHANSYGRAINFTDAWHAWRSGEKFPIAFLGDSTTNGNGTSPAIPRPLPAEDHWGEDYIRPGAYPALLENLIRQASGSTTARCYNLGYSGTNSTFAAANIANMLTGAYADTKMLGISHGINDRGSGVTEKQMAATFRANIESIIVHCLNVGIQPFLLTTQPLLEPGDDIPTINIITSERANSVANRIKHDLAAKWGLELIDVNAAGAEFQSYSAFPLLSPVFPPTGIYEAPDSTIHWANVGHEFIAGLIFSHFCPRVIRTTRGERLDFSTQQVVSDVDRSNITQLAASVDGFKLWAKYDKGSASDIRMQEFWLFNMHRGPLNLTAFAGDAVESAYVKVNGATTPMASVQQSLGALDMGLHRIEAWSGEATAVNWRGFKAVP